MDIDAFPLWAVVLLAVAAQGYFLFSAMVGYGQPKATRWLRPAGFAVLLLGAWVDSWPVMVAGWTVFFVGVGIDAFKRRSRLAPTIQPPSAPTREPGPDPRC